MNVSKSCGQDIRLFVAVTTIPSRAHRIPQFVENILEQSETPEKIIISVCNQYNRERVGFKISPQQ